MRRGIERQAALKPGFSAASSCRGGRGGRGGNDLWLLLETGSAENRSALRRLEGNRGFSAAFRAGGSRFRTDPAAARALCLALLAMLGVVLELFVVEKQLFAGGEHELRSAIVTLQNSVDKFHGRLPQSRDDVRNRP